MRVRSPGAAGFRGVFALSVAASVAACTFTTDLDGYAGAALTGDGGIDDLDGAPAERDAGPGADAAVDAAGRDYGAVVAADHPVAWYRFDDDVSSPSAKDSVAGSDATRSRTGVVFGGQGIAGGAAVFTGTGNLDVGDRFGFAGLVPFSLELWMKPNEGASPGQLFHKRDESVATDFKGWVMYRAADRSVHFEGWGAGISAWTDGPIDRASSATGFSHVVVVVTYATGKGNASVYIDGVRQGPGGFDNTTPLPSTTAHLLLGNVYSGLLDEVALYDKALTFAQITAHFTAGR